MSGAAVGCISHGTKMAYYVKKICPQVRILPIRLDTIAGDHGQDSQSFCLQSVIKVRLSTVIHNAQDPEVDLYYISVLRGPLPRL